MNSDWWLTAPPREMVDWLVDAGWAGATDRKLLLFCQACWEVLHGPRAWKSEWESTFHSATPEDGARYWAHSRRALFFLQTGDDLRGPLLRDLFGDPFGPRLKTLHPQAAPTQAARHHWHVCNGPLYDYERGLVRATALSVYDERSFEELPVLADVLEDAGCPEPSLLEHFRSGGLHVKGCWALDVVLGYY